MTIIQWQQWGAALPKSGGKVIHHAALPWTDIPDALEQIEGSTSTLPAKLAFRFLILTALRSGEVRQLRWEWFDLRKATLTIPAEYMKAGREHRIPLSRQAVDIALLAGENLFDGNGVMFPGRTGKPLIRYGTYYVPTAVWTFPQRFTGCVAAFGIGQLSKLTFPVKCASWHLLTSRARRLNWHTGARITFSSGAS